MVTGRVYFKGNGAVSQSPESGPTVSANLIGLVL